MTPKSDSMFLQKSIYDFLEDFERKRSEEFPPLISIYKKKNDAGENDNVDSHDVEKSVGIAKDPGDDALALHSVLKSEKIVHCETILKEPQSLTPLKIVIDDIELDENTSILLLDSTTFLGPFAIYENYKVKKIR